MLDLYLIITPIFGFLSLMTIINLKLTLTQPKTKDLKKYQKRLLSTDQVQIEPLMKMQVKEQTMQPGYKKTLFYLLKNFTVADLCLVRRSRNKIPLLLSLPIIAILQLIFNIPYVFCFIGPVITLLFVGGKALTDQNQEEFSDDLARIRERVKQKQEKFEQKLQLIFTSLALVLNLAFIGFSFKNYRNNLLESAAINFCITIAIDNLILKPIVLMIVAFPIKNIQFVDTFINKEIQIVEILHQERIPIKVFDAHISALSPKKLYQSPSKIPKAVHVEPRINSENKENYISTIQLTKALRKPKLSPINSKRSLEHHNPDDCSLISILNSNQKKKNHEKNGSYDFDKLFEDRVNEEEGPIPSVNVDLKQKDDEKKSESKYQMDGAKKHNKMKTSKLVLINQDNSIIKNFENEVENQEEEDVNQNKSGVNSKSLRDSDYKTSSRNCEGLKISLHKSIEEQNDLKGNFDAFFEEDANPYVGRPHSTLEENNSMLHYGTITHTSRRDGGLLKINEDRKGEDLEEIDLNSPERRKNQLDKIVEDAQIEKVTKKKKHKKYSLDPNRHVIKHSTGEPYLEFLPNLLNKQRQEKKKKFHQQGSQQNFSNKIDMVNGYFNESRVSKSVKRPKNSNTVILKQNDENKIPEFMIEDFN